MGYQSMNEVTHISTATTTVVKNQPGTLKYIIVTGGTAGTIVVYDNTAGSGKVIASFDSTNTLADYKFCCKFNIGLTVVTGGATKVSVVYQ